MLPLESTMPWPHALKIICTPDPFYFCACLRYVFQAVGCIELAKGTGILTLPAHLLSKPQPCQPPPYPKPCTAFCADSMQGCLPRVVAHNSCRLPVRARTIRRRLVVRAKSDSGNKPVPSPSPEEATPPVRSKANVSEVPGNGANSNGAPRNGS